MQLSVLQTALEIGAAATAALLALTHLLLNKRNVRASIGWSVFILLVPVLGPAAYLILGVNRIQRRALALRRLWVARLGQHTRFARQREAQSDTSVSVPEAAGMQSLSLLSQRVTGLPLQAGNAVQPLSSGAAAMEAMLAAIGKAQQSIGLETYIFDTGPLGLRFIAALTAAQQRGVEVRVLVDAFGLHYSRPNPLKLMKQRGLTTARFNPSRFLLALPHLNLRTHRKLLLVDGVQAFTGGMNIREGLLERDIPSKRIEDLHFALQGPIVEQMAHVFGENWAFASGEALEGPRWFPPQRVQGSVLARAIPDGPDEDLDKLRWVMLGAIAQSQRNLSIQTPYFLPDSDMFAALCVAALRGTRVRILLPERGNLPLVRWAMTPQLPWLMERGCEIRLLPEPFDHSKLMRVDEQWTLLGSSNLDPRSLRLNFEFNVECYDTELASALDALFASRWERARPVDPLTLVRRPLWKRLRDSAARLATPYL